MRDTNTGPDWNTVSLLGFTTKELMPLKMMLDRTGMTIRDLMRSFLEREIERTAAKKVALEVELVRLMRDTA